MNETKSSLAILLSTDILAYWNTVVSPFVLLYLYIFVVSITVIELGRIMRSPEGILTLILNFMNLQSSGRNTKATDKPPTQKNWSILPYSLNPTLVIRHVLFLRPKPWRITTLHLCNFSIRWLKPVFVENKPEVCCHRTSIHSIMAQLICQTF